MTSNRLLRRAALPAAVAAALLLPPASAPAQSRTGQYFRDRVNDFADIFRLRAGTPHQGRGYGAKARATALAQAGYVHFNGQYAGIDRRGIGIVRERRTEGGVSLLYASRHRMETVSGNEFLDTTTLWSTIEDRRLVRNLPYWDDGRGDLLGIGVEVATPVLAIDIGVNPSQFVDFLAGWVRIDPYNDDMLGMEVEHPAWTRTPTMLEPDEEASTREHKARLDALRARIMEQRMIDAGQLPAEEQAEPEALETPQWTPAPLFGEPQYEEDTEGEEVYFVPPDFQDTETSPVLQPEEQP